DAKLVAQGALKLDGKPVNCGKRPTVLTTNFDSWGGAFPGFLILNTKKITGLSTQVKLYIYSHECGHQFIGADETEADLFAIRRGVKWGWLDAQGMEDICAFISQLKGDAVHPPGPQRCETMRKYYRELLGSESQPAAAPASSPQAQTLGPRRGIGKIRRARIVPTVRHLSFPRRRESSKPKRGSKDPGDHQPEDHEED